MSNEQLENLEQLARRAVACKHWRWMPGMRVVTEMGDAFRVEDVDFCYGELNWPKPHALLLPDLTDPATLGCILALVREAHKAPHAWVETRYGQRSRVVSPEGYSEATRMLCEWQVGTEGAALVAALEAAP